MRSNTLLNLDSILKSSIGLVVSRIVGIVLGMFVFLFLARGLPKEEYGLFVLGLTAINIFSMLTVCGFDQSLPRQISYYKGKRKRKAISHVVSYSYLIVLPVTAVVSAAVFMAAGPISEAVFGEPGLTPVLQLFSICIVFLNFSYLVQAVGQGFERTVIKIVLLDIVPNVGFLGLLLAVYLVVNTFYFYIVAFLLSNVVLVVVAAAFLAHLWRSNRLVWEPRRKKEFNRITVDLFFRNIVTLTINWVNILFIGIFMDPEAVAEYNVAYKMAVYLEFLLLSANFLFVPVITRLAAQGDMASLKRIYYIVSRWIFLATLPLIAIVMFWPEAVVGFLFSEKYIVSSLPLRVLTVGFAIHLFFGPNVNILISLGKTRRLLRYNIVSLAVDIVIIAALWTNLYIVGVAVATAAAVVVRNALTATYLKSRHGIHLYNRRYIQALLSMVLVFTTIGYLVMELERRIGEVTIVHVLLLLGLFYLLALVLLRALGAHEPEDRAISGLLRRSA